MEIPASSSASLIRSRSSRSVRHCTEGLVLARTRIKIPDSPRLWTPLTSGG